MHEQGLYSYYGRLDQPTNPKTKVMHYMLDEHIKLSITKELSRLKKEFNELGKALKLDVKEEMKTLRARMKKLEEKQVKVSNKPDEKEAIRKNLKAKGFNVV
jgi:seryl-tRNA synthetase